MWGDLPSLSGFGVYLPNEALIYLADGAGFPYGEKTPEELRARAVKIVRFLMSAPLKALVIACGTMSAQVGRDLREWVPIPLIDVVESSAKVAVAASRSGRIGVLATVSTVRAGAFEVAIGRRCPGALVFSQACASLAPLVEHGFAAHPAAKLVVAHYLRPLLAKGINTLVLGCTHYPLLVWALEDVIPRDIVIVNCAEACALEVVSALGCSGPVAGGQKHFGLCKVFATSHVGRIAQLGGAYFRDAFGAARLVSLENP